jgi:hypothetical protein
VRHRKGCPDREAHPIAFPAAVASIMCAHLSNDSLCTPVAALHVQISGDVGFVEPVQRIQKMREEGSGALGRLGGDLTG